MQFRLMLFRGHYIYKLALGQISNSLKNASIYQNHFSTTSNIEMPGNSKGMNCEDILKCYGGLAQESITGLQS